MTIKTYKIIICTLLLASLFLKGCGSDTDETNIDFRQEMRSFVQGISQYAREFDGDFIVIPQNGQELVTTTGEADGALAHAYLEAIDGVGREDLFYGYTNDDEATPADANSYMVSFCDICKDNGVEVLVIDYCSTASFINSSYTMNHNRGYISFAAPNRELNIIPAYPAQPYNNNSTTISTLKQAQNFLYLLNPDAFSTKQEFINAIAQTDYDLLVIDLFFNESAFTSSELNQLKTKHSGGTRLVLSYMSIGEAEDYRYYWQPTWNTSKPEWLESENPDWPGNFKVKYWYKSWQEIIYGNNGSYLKKIIDAGYDGVYLDIIDAFEYFENR